MTTLDYVFMAVGGGGIAIALAAVVYALYCTRSIAVQVASQATTITVYASKLSDSERNGLTYQQQRDTQTQRADLAESQLADVKAQLVSTQAALKKAGQENSENAAEVIRTAPDPLGALNAELRAEADPGVSSGGDSSAGHGDQSKPAV